MSMQSREGKRVLRPLPPFRAEPLRKPRVPKPNAASRKDEPGAISVKARRLPVKFARLHAAPTLRVLGRDARDHA
jgi:hypothetical protein